MFLKKSFLIRRPFDRWVLFSAAASMPLRFGLGPLVLFVFSCIGVYLAAMRHRYHRHYGAAFFICITVYMLWAMGLMLWRGEWHIHNRQIGYTMLIWLFSFGGLGMVLVRDPMRMFALGSRIGVLLTVGAVVWIGYSFGGRIGVGGNEAVFAYAAGVSAIAATLPVKNAPRWLPNGPWYLIIGTGLVFASETRAVMLPLVLFAVVEIAVLVGRIASHKVKVGSALVLAACLTAVFTIGPAASVLSQRFAGMIHYYETGDSSLWSDKSSADTREQMWRGALRVVAENPLTGVGPEHKMSAVHDALGDQATLLEGYIHVHNAILDELLVNGAIGLALILMAGLCGFVFLWRNNPDCTIRRTLIYFLIVWGSYAMLHNPLLHESSIAVTLFFFSVVYAQTNRDILRRQSGSANVLYRAAKQSGQHAELKS